MADSLALTAVADVSPADGLRTLLDRQRAAFAQDMLPSLEERLDRITRILDITEQHRTALIDAISADFGGRSAHETILGDLIGVIADVKHTRRHLKAWMAPRSLPTRLVFRPSYNRLLRQPLGVVGIVSPWNYPYFLAMTPAIGALAAGNRVMVKPSEITPRFSQLLAEIVAQKFSPEEFAVVTGGPDVGRAFSELPFDHLLYTGSTQVGRLVAQAAAKNLTPVTLELGGKSPAIIDETANLKLGVPRLMRSKLFNAGQTCVAPDYVLLHESHVAAFEGEVRAATGKMYPSFMPNPDYTSIVTDRHFARLTELLKDAEARGARVVKLGAEEDPKMGNRRAMVPSLVFGVDDTMRLMQEEIFGPILPVKTYRQLDEALDYINAHERPLALYWFGENKRSQDRVLTETISGGVTINDCVMHISQLDSPFGGVGASGTGSYHGEYGFRTFSKEKPIFFQSKWAGGNKLRPPYGARFAKLEKIMRKLI